MRAYRKDGSEITQDELLEAYYVTIYECRGPGFRVVEIRERCEAANCDIWVKGQGGELLPGQAVRWGWPGTEVSQNTGPDGRVGFAMSRDAYYDPAVGGGPHWTAVAGNSEVVRGIGMVVSTVHCTLNYVFQYTEGDVEPEPVPEPPPVTPPAPEPVPEPEPIPEVPYILLRGLERLGLAVTDYREQVKAVSKLAQITSRPFVKINGIVIHHTASNAAQTPMGIVDYHIKTRGFATVGYHFIIGWEGQVYFMAPLAWVTPHCGYLNAETIGIAVMGDFTSDLPSNQQVKSLRLLIYGLEEWLDAKWGGNRRCNVLPHSYLRYLDEKGNIYGSACPGKLKEALVWAGDWPGRSL